MEILGTGLSGLVGSKFVDLFSQKYSFSNLDLSVGVDITDIESVRAKVRQSTSPVIIHMAAFTDATKAWEQSGDTHGICYKVNVLGTENIAKAAAEFGKHMIHISTAFVFDGNKQTMYVEDDNTSPIEWYGYTKAKAEEVVQASQASWTIFRIDQPFRSDVFSRPDTAHKLAENLKKPGFKPFKDHWFAPTIIEDLSQVLDWAITHKPSGIFHATCNKKVSDYEYAVGIARALQIDVEITPGSLQEYLEKTQRPYQKNTAMSSSKLMQQATGVKFTLLEEALQKLKM